MEPYLRRTVAPTHRHRLNMRPDNSDPRTPADLRGRRWYAVLGLLLTLVLIGWGGVVTSIDAGLAVPDWPTSFGSLDPIATGFNDPSNPTSRWWQHAPILAEHGHRLMGTLVGLWAVFLVAWTWRTESRRWLRRLVGGVLLLVVFQGLLGGLRVIWVSVDLAVVHALVAQLFFSCIVAVALAFFPAWEATALISSPRRYRFRILSAATLMVLYLQVFLGALLRHEGGGTDAILAVLHIMGAALCLVLMLVTAAFVRRHFAVSKPLQRVAWGMLGVVGVQLVLGFIAFAVLLVEAQMLQRSAAQVFLNSAHLLTGTLLIGTTVAMTLLAFRVLPAPIPS